MQIRSFLTLLLAFATFAQPVAAQTKANGEKGGEARTVAASTVAPPGIGICVSSQPPGQTGTTVTPGLWGNPKRFGTGWHIEATVESTGLPGSPQFRQYNFYWLTYDATRKPVWFKVGPVSIAEGATTIPVQPIRRTLWLGAPGQYFESNVGNFSATLIPSRPNQLAIAWELQGVPGIQEECITDAFRPAMQYRGSGTPSPAAFQGLWKLPNPALEGILVSNFSNTAGSYTEVINPLLFDSAGEPVWLHGAKQNLTAANLGGPQTYTAAELSYNYSNYAGGIPLSDCTDATNPSCKGTVAFASGVSISRTFLPNAIATIAINQVMSIPSPAPTTQTINFAVASAPLSREPSQSFVVPNKYFCATSGISSNCPILFDWSFPTRGTNPGLQVFLNLYRVTGNISQLQQQSTVLGSSGQQSFNLNAGTYRVELTS